MSISKYSPKTGITRHLMCTGIRNHTKEEANEIWTFMCEAEDKGFAEGCNYTSWGKGLYRFTGIFTDPKTAMIFKIRWDSDKDEVPFEDCMK